MKVVILAGGFGTRISEESHLKPKPMVGIGDRPILWHIMKMYSQRGFNDFIICLGYKGYIIKEYFANYFLHTSDVTFDLKNNKMEVLNNFSEPWKVTLVDTGLYTGTAGRIKRIKDYVGNEPFMLTYGDGVSDIDMNEVLQFHKKHKKIVTITAVSVDQKYGVLNLDDNNIVRDFREKSENDRKLINGGFMVLEPKVFDYISSDEEYFEREPLEKLARDGQLIGYRYEGFWKCMDMLRDKNQLEEMWNSGNAPWKTWKD